ncbi:hypothetical protein [Collinsella vaginalis]|uniref:hypothetical protein n=1 Tax=Collinsella vaginalis TaxID=1870987 RepID=UPI000A2689BE|nr:hypothetical protein [Collinsella vaginalis]
MGFIQKKDEEKDVIEGVEIIGRGEGPNGVDENPVVIVPGESAEDIAAGTTAEAAAADAEAQALEDAADASLMEGIQSADADDDDEDEDDEDDPVADDPTTPGGPIDVEPPHGGANFDALQPGRNRRLLFGALAAAVIIIVALCGYFIGRGGFGVQGASGATVSEDQLDTVIASWSYNGQDHKLTVRDAIEDQSSLDSAKDSDGNYRVPSAETVLAYARNRILVSEAEARNLTVSDDEATQYAEDHIGTSDYSTLATQYCITEDQAKRIVKENALISKLYAEVVPDSSTSTTAPTAPAEPENGDTSTASKDYADYIIKLAGDEWDSSKGTWAREDGPYYSALKDEQFTADSATYAQAQAAYYVAYQQYSQQVQSGQSTWRTFVNGLYAKASVDLYGLYM